MRTQNIHLAYFSATYTTQKIVRAVAQQLGGPIIEHDLTNTQLTEDILLTDKDLLIVGAPVYAGRIPSLTISSFNCFKGNNTPAIIIAVYGNREYDDALLELKDLTENNCFKPIAAAAFIAQHSIFPQVATQRPDENDLNKIEAFGQTCAHLINDIQDLTSLPKLQVKGNYPYKEVGKVPLHPSGNDNCSQCLTCVDTCPTHAITKNNPRETDTDKCISCGRCIVVCPTQARNFYGAPYETVSQKFIQANSQRKEPEIFILSATL